MLCRELATEFRPHEDALAGKGVRLYFVGTAAPFMAKAFREDMQLKSAIWVDPDRRTYQHLGFKRGVLTLASPKATLNYARAFLKGFRNQKIQGDAVQQGGVLVLKRGGEPVYSHASAEAGDHPPLNEVLEAAARAIA